MYYVYRHTRKDKQEVFYIGIGTINTTHPTMKCYYRRAFEKNKSRSEHWKNIVSKTEYEVEIIFHSKSIKEIQQKEIEFIALYKDTLCNQTDGGLGITSYKHTKEAKDKIRQANLGLKHSKDRIRKINERKFVPIRMYNETFSKDFKSITDAAIFLGDEKCKFNIARYLRNGKAKVKGFMFKKL